MSVHIVGQIPEGTKYTICRNPQCRLVLAYQESDTQTSHDTRDNTWTKSIQCPICRVGVTVADDTGIKEKHV